MCVKATVAMLTGYGLETGEL